MAHSYIEAFPTEAESYAVASDVTTRLELGGPADELSEPKRKVKAR